MTAEPAPATIVNRLEPGETVLWWGQPRQGVWFRRGDWFAVPFGLLWVVVGFGVAGKYHPLLGLAILLFCGGIGVYFAIGRYFHDARRRDLLWYGLTPDRVLIVGPDAMRSIELRGLSELHLKAGPGGTGSIVLGRLPPKYDGGELIVDIGGTPRAPTLEGIADAAQVHAMIEEMRTEFRREDAAV